MLRHLWTFASRPQSHQIGGSFYVYTKVQDRPFHASCRRLAGHNKWSKIKQKKGANDAAKGNAYNRATLSGVRTSIRCLYPTLSKVQASRRIYGSRQQPHAKYDPQANQSSRRTKREHCKSTSKGKGFLKLVKSRADPKVCTQASKEKLGGEILTYEAIACNSHGIIILAYTSWRECMTDNAKRTVQNLREILSDKGARMAPVGFMFKRNGSVKIALEKGDDSDQRLEKLVEIALDNGAEDFNQLPDGEGEGEDSQIEVEFICEPSSLSTLTDALLKTDSTLVTSELVYTPLETVEPSEEDSSALEDLVDALEGHEDTIRVWTSCS
ncbi:hypothetical protein D9758_012179 [Tetrapyrgos nigripes]|uniref:TACO1/YebC-like second and third domain-containing protein n=1 Tax=Tetrapyrgos nigripes TaxID=182062 RepID=A0A8H5CFN6_9AGAR|nr:hypothetical protein D9758_012179 [Tetrapyrgos nigripes]